MKISEKEVQRSVIEYLTYKKIFFFRNNTGALKTENGGFVRFGQVGSPDIFAMLNVNGLCAIIGIEIKSSTGKQSENQKQWEKNFKEVGGFYSIIRNIEELEEILLYANNKTLSYLSKRNKS